MKLAVCDDEKNIREYIAERIRAADGDMQIVQYETAADILASGLSMDILFLDIQLPDSSGLEAARKLRERGSRAILVFVTAAEEYVFDAFDVNALGYIVKPFEEKKLDEVIVKAIDAAKKQRRIEEALSALDNGGKSRSILVKSAAGITNILLSDIAYAEIFNRRIVLHSRDKSTVEYYGRMKELEGTVGSDFFRVHRSYLINMAYVKAYTSKNVVVNGEDIPVARGKYQKLVKAYLSYFARREGL